MKKIFLLLSVSYFGAFSLYAQEGVLVSGAKPSPEPQAHSDYASSGGMTVDDYVQKVARTAFENLITQIVSQQIQAAQMDVTQDEIMQIVFQTQSSVSEHPNIQMGLQTAYRNALQAVSMQKDRGAPGDVLEQTVQETIANTYREFKMNELIDTVAQHFIQQITMAHQEVIMNQAVQMQAQQQMMEKMQAMEMQKSQQPAPAKQGQPADDPRSFHIP